MLQGLIQSVNKRTTIISAFVFFILPEGKGLVGRSNLSTLMSNKSFDTRPPSTENGRKNQDD